MLGTAALAEGALGALAEPGAFAAAVPEAGAATQFGASALALMGLALQESISAKRLTQRSKLRQPPVSTKQFRPQKYHCSCVRRGIPMCLQCEIISSAPFL